MNIASLLKSFVPIYRGRPSEGARDTLIPRIVHQTWKDRDVPKRFSKYMASWRKIHPDWEFKFWTDADLAEVVAARYPEYREMYLAYPKPIMRADLGRYLVLREFGGIYADVDAEALASFEPLLDSPAPIFAFEPPSHADGEWVRSRGFQSIISNAVMLSPAGHPFWDHMLSRIRECRHATNPLDATGPFLLTAAVELAPPNTAPRVLPAHVFSPCDKFGAPVSANLSARTALAAHHWAGTWWKPAPPPPRGFFKRPKNKIASDNLVIPPPASVEAQPIDIMAASEKNKGVLIAVPVRDAANTLDALFARLLALRYHRGRLSVAFLEGDSVDDSWERLRDFARRHAAAFRRIEVIKHDSGVATPIPRWDPASQKGRRSQIASVRNELVARTLRDEDWVLWVDADIIEFPADILATLISANARIVHPNAVRIPGGPSMDLNAWVAEEQLPPTRMAPWIQDGLYQPPSGFFRLYLSDLRYRDKIPLHSVGGTMLLVDADLHRAGLLFPTDPYHYLIETEGFAAIARHNGIIPLGLPNVEVLHASR